MDIVSKFAVASEHEIKDRFFLEKAKYKGMYENSVPADELDLYIDGQLNYRSAVSELNALNNQMIILYVDGKPAGFAILRQNAVCPGALQGKNILNCSFFYILPEYDNTETRASLWQKCLSVSKTVEAVWIEVLQNDPFVAFLESLGFIIGGTSVMAPFDRPSFILIRYKNNIAQ